MISLPTRYFTPSGLNVIFRLFSIIMSSLRDFLLLLNTPFIFSATAASSAVGGCAVPHALAHGGCGRYVCSRGFLPGVSETHAVRLYVAIPCSSEKTAYSQMVTFTHPMGNFPSARFRDLPQTILFPGGLGFR